MKKHHLSFFWTIATLVLSFSECIGADANVLTGIGYINLNGNNSASIAPLGSGGHFVWKPSAEDGALFVGNVSTNNYNVSNSSLSLLATGYTSSYSVAIFGSSSENATAVGYYSTSAYAGVAIGSHALATGLYSTAVGAASDSENSSSPPTALSGSSLAMGSATTATAQFSIALGFNVLTSGYASTGLGVGARCVGDYSTSLGTNANVIGDYSAALGYGAVSYSLNSIALGSMNRGDKRKDQTTVDPVVADSRDPLFTLGKGTTEYNRANAVAVYRDGDMHLAGSMRMKRAGDISMGSFTAGPSWQP